MFNTNDFSLEACKAYQLRCQDAFVGDFFYSKYAARLVYRFPILLDAMACVGQRRGQAFLDFFGEVMTGVKPKIAFLKPGLLLDLTIEILRQFFLQHIMNKPPLVPANIGMSAVYGKSASSKFASSKSSTKPFYSSPKPSSSNLNSAK
jgi:hypothetical protein